MKLFYHPHIAEIPFLPEEESLHCIKVLRCHVGDIIQVIDGKGNLYDAEIQEAHPKHTSIKVVAVHHHYAERPFKLHLAVAPTKNIDRFEWFVEKAVEIGVDVITPLNCRFSERHVLKPERIEKIIVAAAKQSLKAYVPTLQPMIDFDDFIMNMRESERFIAHCYSGEKPYFLNVCPPKKDVVVLIGPEGDFSKEEVALAEENHCISVSLGDSRLRTETAGVVACHLVTVVNSKKDA